MKGLIFSEPMMKAWMEGRKTVTRRLIKIPPDWFILDRKQGEILFSKMDAQNSAYDAKWIKPRYLPGETVYIQEVWCAIDLESGYAMKRQPKSKDGVCFVYRAGCDAFTDSLVHQWFTPRFMPEQATRSYALIVSVRPEKIQSITPEEVKKEGLVVRDFAGIGVLSLLGLTPETYMESIAMMEFEALWESLHPASWVHNDWVFRYELEKK